jgi:hypothetical protein
LTGPRSAQIISEFFYYAFNVFEIITQFADRRGLAQGIAKRTRSLLQILQEHANGLYVPGKFRRVTIGQDIVCQHAPCMPEAGQESVREVVEINLINFIRALLSLFSP